jgi:hypothetical protein
VSETASMPRPLTGAEQAALIEELQHSSGAPMPGMRLPEEEAPPVARLYVEPGRAVCRYPGCAWAVVGSSYAASTGHKDRRFIAEGRRLSEAAVSHAMAHGMTAAVDDLTCDSVRRLLSAPVLGEVPRLRSERCTTTFSVVAPMENTPMRLHDALRTAFDVHWTLCPLQRTIARKQAEGEPLLHPAAPEHADTLMPVLWHWDWRSKMQRPNWENL